MVRYTSRIGLSASWASTPHLFAETGDFVVPRIDVVARVDRWAYIFADTEDSDMSHIIGKMQKGNKQGLALDR